MGGVWWVVVEREGRVKRGKVEGAGTEEMAGRLIERHRGRQRGRNDFGAFLFAFFSSLE